MSEKFSGGQIVVKVLESLGVRHIFGVPGGQTLAITDALIGSKIVFITARHENAAAVMADAYGRLTGKPGVCLSTTGPGATNLLTGVGGAFRDSSPAIVITCNNRRENINKDDAQNADHVNIFTQFTKLSRLVSNRSSIKQSIEEAYISAVSGNPGPVHLDFSRETLEDLSEDFPIVAEEHPLLSWVQQFPRPDSEILSKVIEMLFTAKKPVMWLGNGCKKNNAAAAAISLAEKMNIPIITTFNGIGLVPTTHPLVFGTLNRMGTNLSSRVISESDLVIAVGNSLNAVSTSRWTLNLPKIIQIDIEPKMLGRDFAEKTFGVLAGADAALKDILHELSVDSRVEESKISRAKWISELEVAKTNWWIENQESSKSAKLSKISPVDIILELRKNSPQDTILIADAGNPGIWSFAWEITKANTYLKPVGFGNMGFSVPAAIAAVTVNPSIPVIVLVGDGSLGMTLGELETLARVGGKVAVVVLNDNAYGNIRQEQILYFNKKTIGVEFSVVDYSKVAIALGMKGEKISDIKLLGKSISEVLNNGSPTLFDIQIDPDLSAWTFPSFKKYESKGQNV